jgi:hypothetical protein
MLSLMPIPELSFSEIPATGSGVTRRFVVNVDLHNAVLVIITENEVGFAGETIMEFIVAPVLHKYDDPPVALNVALSPKQTILSLGNKPDVSVSEILPLGNAFIVIKKLSDLAQLSALVTVTI